MCIDASAECIVAGLMEIVAPLISLKIGSGRALEAQEASWESHGAIVDFMSAAAAHTCATVVSKATHENLMVPLWIS